LSGTRAGGADKATGEGDSRAGTGTPGDGSSKAGTETTGRVATADTTGEGGVSSSTGATELQKSLALRALRSSTGNEVSASGICVQLERREGERTRLPMSFAKAGERQWKANEPQAGKGRAEPGETTTPDRELSSEPGPATGDKGTKDGATTRSSEKGGESTGSTSGVASEKDETGVSVSSENSEVAEGSRSGSRLITDWATADCSVQDSLAQARPA
jgi:hypothetical protein